MRRFSVTLRRWSGDDPTDEWRPRGGHGRRSVQATGWDFGGDAPRRAADEQDDRARAGAGRTGVHRAAPAGCGGWVFPMTAAFLLWYLALRPARRRTRASSWRRRCPARSPWACWSGSPSSCRRSRSPRPTSASRARRIDPLAAQIRTGRGATSPREPGHPVTAAGSQSRQRRAEPRDLRGVRAGHARARVPGGAHHAHGVGLLRGGPRVHRAAERRRDRGRLPVGGVVPRDRGRDRRQRLRRLPLLDRLPRRLAGGAAAGGRAAAEHRAATRWATCWPTGCASARCGRPRRRRRWSSRRSTCSRRWPGPAG